MSLVLFFVNLAKFTNTASMRRHWCMFTEMGCFRLAQELLHQHITDAFEMSHLRVSWKVITFYKLLSGTCTEKHLLTRSIALVRSRNIASLNFPYSEDESMSWEQWLWSNWSKPKFFPKQQWLQSCTVCFTTLGPLGLPYAICGLLSLQGLILSTPSTSDSPNPQTWATGQFLFPGAPRLSHLTYTPPLYPLLSLGEKIMGDICPY